MATTQKNHSVNDSKSNHGNTSKSNSGNNSSNFANMDVNKQRNIASKGGKASHSGGHSSGK
ncbi:KGG domain-containing protein [Mucilaginibacter sp.]